MLRGLVALGLGLSLAACGSDDGGDDGGGGTAPWRSDAKLPVAAQELAAVTVADKIYVAGGFEGVTDTTHVRIYDPASDSWSSAPDLPAPRHHLALAAIGADVYAVGGMTGPDFTPVDTLYVLKAGAAAWDKVASLTLSRGAGYAAAVGDKVYVLGGQGDNELLMGDVIEYDPASGNWTVASKLPTPRDHLAGFVHGGKIHTVGGRFGTVESGTDRVEIFDPATKTWSDGPALPTPRGGLGAAVLGDRAFAIGGETAAAALDVVEELDLGAGAWETAPPLTTPRHGAAVAAAAGRIYVIGGASAPGFGAVDVVESYAP